MGGRGVEGRGWEECRRARGWRGVGGRSGVGGVEGREREECGRGGGEARAGGVCAGAHLCSIRRTPHLSRLSRLPATLGRSHPSHLSHPSLCLSHPLIPLAPLISRTTPPRTLASFLSHLSHSQFLTPARTSGWRRSSTLRSTSVPLSHHSHISHSLVSPHPTAPSSPSPFSPSLSPSPSPSLSCPQAVLETVVDPPEHGAPVRAWARLNVQWLRGSERQTRRSRPYHRHAQSSSSRLLTHLSHRYHV